MSTACWSILRCRVKEYLRYRNVDGIYGYFGTNQRGVIMPYFILTPQIKAQRRKLRFEMAMLILKKKIFGNLSDTDEKRRKEIIFELSRHY